MDAQGNRYGPYDLDVPGSFAEPLTEDAWFTLHRETGVVSGGTISFNGRTASLAPVELRVHGSWLSREQPWTDTSPATTTAVPRRDLLVARRQRTVGVGQDGIPGKTYLTVLRGTPAANPQDPPYDRLNDEPLWSWQVPASGGNVITAVRDRRRGAYMPAPGLGSIGRYTEAGPSPANGAWISVEGLVLTFTLQFPSIVEAVFDVNAVSNVAGTTIGASIYSLTDGARKTKTVTIEKSNVGETLTIFTSRDLPAGTHTWVIQQANRGGGGGAFFTADPQEFLIKWTGWAASR